MGNPKLGYSMIFLSLSLFNWAFTANILNRTKHRKFYGPSGIDTDTDTDTEYRHSQ